MPALWYPVMHSGITRGLLPARKTELASGPRYGLSLCREAQMKLWAIKMLFVWRWRLGYWEWGAFWAAFRSAKIKV